MHKLQDEVVTAGKEKTFNKLRTFADSEVQCKEYQVVRHSNPLGEIHENKKDKC